MVKQILKLRIFIYFLIPIVIWTLPVNLIDNMSFCLYYNFFNFKCPTCGLTRAFFHMLHFDIKGAIMFNKLVIIVFPLIVILVIIDSCRIIFNK